MSQFDLDSFVAKLRVAITKTSPKNSLQFISDFANNYQNNKPNKIFMPDKKSLQLITPQTKNILGFDIGGTLCKICFVNSFKAVTLLSGSNSLLEKCPETNTLNWKDKDLSFETQGKKFQFLKFPTEKFVFVVDLLVREGFLKEGDKVFATGGGAFKYAKEVKRFRVEFIKKDELQCLYKGLNFVLEHVQSECYYFPTPLSRKRSAYNLENMVYPYILTNIGSGVSILKVNSPTSIERVSGSFIGGGTYWGLCKLLTGIQDYNEINAAAREGDNKTVDMLVSDIYGGDYEQFGLKGDIIAACFGKTISANESFKPKAGDIAKSMVNMIGVNIAQIAHFCAKIHCIDRILFAGNFLRQNPLTQNSISMSIKYWSGGKMKALFLEHEGFFGSIGVLLGDE